LSSSLSSRSGNFRIPNVPKTPKNQRLEQRLPPTVWVWKKFILKTIRIYPNGVCRFAIITERKDNGERKWLPYNPTFTLLKLRTEDLEMLRDESGRLKEPWLTKLAFLLAETERNQRLSEFDLIGAALQELIIRNSGQNSKKVSVEIAPNIHLKLN